MYIEYITPQRVADPNITEYDSRGGEYRPTWLIRTSDWQKVPGHKATNGYHTLSYCWEQSGEKFQKDDGQYDLIDNGHHQVIREKDGIMTSCHGTYDELLQQICKDFDIEYLWYDKICIDQTNKAEKYREIKQMHLIYSNACYTVALVPEINIDNPKYFDETKWLAHSTQAKSKAMYQMEKSLWYQRSWTLEEVMMSTRILVVGRNTHFWSLANFKQGSQIKENDFLAHYMLGFKGRKVKSANLVLEHAHTRTSTKEHDRIYALANIFADLVSINIDYTTDVSTAMNTFYRHLAEKDLSLMCFGSASYPNGDPVHAISMRSHKLPSWTGVFGKHSGRPISDITLDQNCDYTIDKYMRLHIQCRSYTIRPSKYKGSGVHSIKDDTRKLTAKLNSREVVTSMDDFDGDENAALDCYQWCIFRATCCVATHYYKPDDHAAFLSPILPLSLTEDCDECVILGVVFESAVAVLTVGNVIGGEVHSYLSPVAKRITGNFYRIIGVVLLRHFQVTERRGSPQEVMDQMFNNLGCETREFCIR